MRRSTPGRLSSPPNTDMMASDLNAYSEEMPTEDPRRAFSREFTAAARTYAPDVISSAILFISASLVAGRVWRFPFDDEVAMLTYVERSHSVMELLGFQLRGAGF